MSSSGLDRQDEETEHYNHKGPSAIEVIVFLICLMMVVGFIGVVVWMFVDAG